MVYPQFSQAKDDHKKWQFFPIQKNFSGMFVQSLSTRAASPIAMFPQTTPSKDASLFRIGDEACMSSSPVNVWFLGEKII